MQQYKLRFDVSCRLFVVLIAVCVYSPMSADPQPGDIFREYHFSDGHGIHLCTQGAVRDSVSFFISVDDLKGAVRAEITGLFHTGHIGTSERMISINGGRKYNLPSAEIVGERDDCYFTYIFGRPSVPVSVKDLQEGLNKLTMSVGPQVCYAFNWPCYGFHSMILRVYYDDSKPHAVGNIEYPKSGHVITGDRLMIKTKVKAGTSAIASVDIIGYYYGYPFEGSGKYRDWHYMIDEYGRWYSFIDRGSQSPYHETWDLSWLPDQDMPMKIMARVTGVDGISYMTPAVENIELKREGYSVTMYKTVDLPENFKVRIKETMKSSFEAIPDLSNITGAQLVSIIPVGHLESKSYSICGINGRTLRRYENLPDLNSDFFYDAYLPVDHSILRSGTNEFFIHSDTEGHMTEVCWPGPALLVRRDGS